MSTTDAPTSSVRERYELLRRLGQGGYGVVYEARDQSTSQRVALKELTAVNALTVAHFKQEFRAMQEVNHPNLVRLDSLFESDGKWYIAMELVEGLDLLESLYVDRADRYFDEARLRDVFSQLCEGLSALHAAGFVHRDLKPENVRVTREERTVLLDFGLTTGIDPSMQATRFTGLGTLAYMAPEQAEGGKVGPAADWYAFGVCLYQAMTGVLPVDGTNPLAMLAAKQQTPAPRAATQAPNIPEDLDELCDALLSIDPKLRPDARTIRRTLAGTLRVPVGMSGRPASMKPLTIGVAFEGREQELLELTAAAMRSASGSPEIVLVEGDSGIGKTALVEHFLTGPLGATVLRSRCYESELLAYKAFDGAMIELASHLCRMQKKDRDALMPERPALLRRLFPALEAVDSIATAPLHGATVDPSLKRFEVFSVFTQLLVNLGRARPLVLVVDDLQWADAESFALLKAVLAQPRLRCLVLATVRPRGELEGDAAEGLRGLRSLPCTRDLVLRGLPFEAAKSLARRVMGPVIPTAWIETIATESAGHPLFLTVLSRFAGQRDPRGRLDLTLDLAISTHIGSLSRKARRLLEAVAVNGAPLAAPLCARVAHIPEDELGRLTTELCRQKLLRRRKAGQLACFHDRIRIVAVSCMTAEDRGKLHAKLAAALAKLGQADPRVIARHHEAAGELEQARLAYIAGAERASTGLAFGRAAALYAKALELGATLNLPEAQAHSLRVCRGHVLARAGRSADAAREFFAAGAQTRGEEQTRLRILATQHLLQSAAVEEGMAAARALLSDLGLNLSESRFARRASMGWARTLMQLRELRVLRSPTTFGPRDRMLLDALSLLSLPFAWLDPLGAAMLATHHLRLARAVGDSAHIARALAEDAFIRQFADPSDSAIDRLLETARALANNAREPALEVRVALREGAVAAVRGELPKALERFEQAQSVVAERCPDEPWLLTHVRTGIAPIWAATLEHAKLSAAMTTWVAEANERSDRFALALLEGIGGGYLRHLMADEPDKARAAVETALTLWPRDSLSLAGMGEASAMSHIALYRGGSTAYTWFEGESSRLSQTLMMTTRLGRAGTLAWHALACIAAMLGETAHVGKARLAQARELARSLAALGLNIATLRAELILSQLDALAGDQAAARTRIEEARRVATSYGNRWIATSLLYLQGVVEGDAPGMAQREVALQMFAAQGWRAPRKAVRLLCPAIDVLEGRALGERAAASTASKPALEVP